MPTVLNTIADIRPQDIAAALLRSGLSQGDIARETGLNSSTVSRICRGKYGNDGEAIAQVVEVIQRALEGRGQGAATPVGGPTAADFSRLTPAVADLIQAAAIPAPVPAQAPGPRPVAPVAQLENRLAAARLPEAPPGLSAPWGGSYCTDGQRVMWGVLRAIAEDRELGLVCSLSGTGKSYVIDRFAEQYPGTLVYRPLRGISQSGVMEDLCRLFGLPYSGSNDTRRRRLLDGCAGRTLLVDEADLLVAGRYATQAVDRLEVYRQLQERGCAVALVGLPTLLATVTRGGETYVFSRIGYARSPAAPTEAELATYWRAQIAGYPQAHARAGLVALSAGKHGYLRYLDKLAKRTRATNGDVAAAETLLFRGEGA